VKPMEIKILGTGCPKCKKLEANIRQAVEENKIKVKITKISDISKIMEYGLTSMPAVIIDDEVKCYGRLPEVSEIKKWL
jgi:small redox-active disulfide protein 2